MYAAGAIGGGALTLGLNGYIPFSLTATYATGAAYQPVIKQIEAFGREGANIRLNPTQIRALLQNIQDVLNGTYQSALKDPIFIKSLEAQAKLGRFRYLNQIPPEAQSALRDAFEKLGVKIP